MKKLILFAFLLTTVALSAQNEGNSRDFWHRPVRVNTSNITPVPTVPHQIIVSDTNSRGAVRYVPKDFATAAAEAGVGGGDLGYKEYVAFLTQSGTSAPTDSVLFNNIGTVTWTRQNVGRYRAQLNGGSFPGNTWFMFGPSTIYETTAYIKAGFDGFGTNNFNIEVHNHADDAFADSRLYGTPITIRIYD